jgi:hypothetical protein
VTKDSPNADRLRAQREARYGHLQATAEPKPPVKRKLIPFAGKETKGIAPATVKKRAKKAKS